MSATLSVVLPNYNHAHLISRALSALLAQERAPDEIIVIDDGSTDNSLDVVREYAADHPAIHLLVNPRNCGAIASLNRGFQAARGSHVYFAAADDWVDKAFFAEALAALEAHPDLALFCGEAQLLDGAGGHRIGTRPPVRPRYRAGPIDARRTQRLLARSDNWILTGAAVFRRDAVAWAGGFDERMGSFADGIMTRKLALTFGFYFSPRVVLTWNIFPNSVSRRTASDPQEALAMLDAAVTALTEDPVFPRWYARVFADRWRFSTSLLALASEPINKDLVAAMAGRSRLDLAMLRALQTLPTHRLVERATAAWLWLRLRPITLAGVAHTAIARRMESRRNAPHRPAPASERGAGAESGEAASGPPPQTGTDRHPPGHAPIPKDRNML